MSPPDPARLRLLEECGYGLAWAEQGGLTCILRRGHERWLGHGATRGEALEDALAAALPSHLGESLLREALRHRVAVDKPAALESAPEPTRDSAHGPEPTEAPATDWSTSKRKRAARRHRSTTLLEPRSPAETVPRSRPTPDSDLGFGERPEPLVEARVETDAPPVETNAPTVETDSAPVETDSPPVETDAPPVDTAEGEAGVGDSHPRAASEPETKPRFPPPPARPLHPALARDRLDRIVEAVEQSCRELANAAAPRQRLQLTAWIAEARGLEAALPGDGEVHGRVTAMAGRLGRLTKAWWPGTTPALFRLATPERVGRELLGQSCSDWFEVATGIEELLASELPRQTDGSPIDWQDDRALQPEPLDPSAQFAEARAVVRRLLGSLDLDPPDWRPFARQWRPSEEDREALLRAARQLRWTRESDIDMESWARALGRLRWLEHHGAASADLARVLDPVYRPTGSWASELGQDPEQRWRRRQLRDLLRLMDQPAMDEAQLRSWLCEALGLGGDVLAPRRMASLLHPERTRIRSFDESGLGLEDRATRRRFRRLLEELEELDEAGAAAERASLEQEAGAEQEPDEPDEPLPTTAARTPGRELASMLEPLVAGKRALFISNRKDGAACDELSRLLGLEVEEAVASPRRTASAREAIVGGRYHFVLAATGFIGHSTEDVLLDACRNAGTTYVRTYKARPLSVLRALARELGVTAEAAAVR